MKMLLQARGFVIDAKTVLQVSEHGGSSPKECLQLEK